MPVLAGHRDAQRPLSDAADFHGSVLNGIHCVAPQCRLHFRVCGHQGGYDLSVGLGRPYWSRRSHGTRAAGRFAFSRGISARRGPCRMGRGRARGAIALAITFAQLSVHGVT